MTGMRPGKGRKPELRLTKARMPSPGRRAWSKVEQAPPGCLRTQISTAPSQLELASE
jgi:hypothetical protein